MPSPRWLILALPWLLAACVTRLPAPVREASAPARVEPARPAPAAASTAASAPSAPAVKMHTVQRGETLIGISLEHGLDYRELATWNNIENPSRIQPGQQLRLAPPPATPAATATPPVSEVRPIGGMDAVVARPLNDAGAVSPAPTLAPAERDGVKRAPLGGKLPYSEENLALLRSRETGASPVAPAAAVPTVVSPAAAPAQAGPATVEAAGIEWSWPAQGALLARFNESRAGQEVNKGIDIGGRVGDPVLAAAAGRVIYVGVFPKHGNLVVVLHANGHSSVYAHNQRILVKEGQMVTRGQQIAALGDSDAERPKLHFEVRHQGKPLDPMIFLPPRP